MPNVSNTSEPQTRHRLAAPCEADNLKLGEKQIEFGQLRLAGAREVTSRDVNDLPRVAEVRGAHVFRIGICA